MATARSPSTLVNTVSRRAPVAGSTASFTTSQEVRPGPKWRQVAVTWSTSSFSAAIAGRGPKS